MYAFGRVMRRLISQHGVTQADIVRETGIGKQNVSWLCKGKTQYPSIQTCKLIATFFGLTLDELYALIEAEEQHGPQD